MIATISRPTLRFTSDALEREFRVEYARSIIGPTRVATVVIIGLFVAYGGFYTWTDRMGTLWPLRAGIIVILGAILASTWHPAFVRAQPWILAAGAILLVGTILAMLTLGYETGIPSYPWIGATIIVTFALFRIRFLIALVATLMMLAAYVIRILSGTYPSEDPFAAGLFLAACFVIGALAGWTIESYAREGFLARKRLEEEQARSERLLLNVLPESIAKRLKMDPAPIADRFPEASILFADVVHFTELSKRMQPEALVGLLNRLFTGFDLIVEKHGLEKIKTIGDGYMAVSGVPEPCGDHLERIADAALEMRQVTVTRGNPRGASDADMNGPALALRIGIDTGPVVAGVIGEKKFSYDLWGDPVTMASRMESHGVAGEIQVTEAVWERLRDRYALVPRGLVLIKGRGEARTFFLRGASDQS
jgi:class 3 adenylate cyclase